MQTPNLRLSFRQLLVIVLAQLLALTIQAWLSRILVDRGYEQLQAHYLAYLAVPPILLVTLAPILLEKRQFLQRLLILPRPAVRLILTAVALGVTMRVAWWAQLIARVSFGMTRDDDSQSGDGLVLSIACPPLPALALGVLVMAILIPLMEETLHRGLLQSAFARRGPWRAIMTSALIFTVFHPPSSYGFVFLLGIMLGVQFWVTGSLWTTAITHSIYNGLVQFDWRCLRGHWNPPPESVPLVGAGSMALVALTAAILIAIGLLRCQWAGAQDAPAATAIRTPPRRAQ
jgi:membrane protease YdiL (CAAX protease family)